MHIQFYSLFVLHLHPHPPTQPNKHPTKFCNFILQERGNLSPKRKVILEQDLGPLSSDARGDPDQLGNDGDGEQSWSGRDG